MARTNRIPKSREARLVECETHLYFLWDARRLYPEQHDHYKQVATELRVLIGDHKPARRLLLSMMDEFNFTYEVPPPPPPFDKLPIPMVGWREDPSHLAVDDKATIEEALASQAALRRPVPFPEYVERALAVSVGPRDYSFRDLVLAISQQVGSSHEDTAVDVPLMQLVQMGSVSLGGEKGHIAPLITFADLVLTVGQRFLGHVTVDHGYAPKHFQIGAE